MKRQAAAATGSLPDVRQARIWLFGFAGFLVLVVLAVWQVPQWLDWSRYRSTIEAIASATLGRHVSIEGPIGLTLLPEPILTATKVDIGEGTSDLSLHVKALRLRVALWPLLEGRVDARDLVLRGADMHIASLAEANGLRPPEWLAAFSVRVEEGSLTVGRLGFTDINAVMRSADTGAVAASGSARFNEQDWHFTARLTSSGSDGSAGLDATLDGLSKAAGFGANLSGQFAANGSFNGNISTRGPNLAMLLPAPAVPFRADGRLTIGGGLVLADDLLLQIGGSPASGAVALRMPPGQRLDFALSMNRLDLDAWLPVLMNASNTVAGIDMPIGLDLSASAASLGGDSLQNVKAAFEISDHALVLHDSSALLPGNGAFRLTGRIARADAAHLRFEGDAKVEAPLLRTTLQWLSIAAPEWLSNDALSHLSESVLQQASLAAHVVADRSELLLDHVTGRIDTSTVTGSFRLQRGNTLSLSARLSADRATLNDWIPALASVSQKISARDLLIGADVANGGFALHRFDAKVFGMQVSASGQLDKDKQLTSGQLSIDAADAAPLAAMLPEGWRATPALWRAPLHLSLRADGSPNALGVSADLSLDDATLHATPTIDLRSGSWNGELTIRHPGARRLLAAIGLPQLLGSPNLPVWLGDGSLSLVAHAHGAAGQVSADSFQLTAGSVRLDGTFSLDDAGNEPRLAAQLHTPELQIPVVSLTSTVPLPVHVLHGWRADIVLNADDMTLESEAKLHEASAIVRVSDGALRIERLSAKFNGGTVDASGLLNGSANPPSFAFNMRLDQATIAEPIAGTPIDVTSGLVNGRLDIAGTGYSPATIVATLAGHVALTVSDGAISGFDLLDVGKAAQQHDPVAAQKAADQALSSGTTSFDRLDITGDLAHGDLTLDKAHLQSGTGEADAMGDINLPTQTLDLRITLRPANKDTLELSSHMFGPFAHPNRTSELANLARFIAERTH